MSSDDPWREINATPRAGLAARRVDAGLPWDLFWVRDTYGKPGLLLRGIPGDVVANQHLPRLSGIDAQLIKFDEDEQGLVLTLLDSGNTDIFRDLCLSIIDGTRGCSTPKQAMDISIQRTWRWHRLLQGASLGRLSSADQQGLLGELSLLESSFAKHDHAVSLNAWRGPLGAPKDFEFPESYVEVKTRRAGAEPFVRISSEFQLADVGESPIFLAVFDVTPSAGSREGQTVADLASKLVSEIERVDPSLVGLFEGRLLAYGFDWGDDYSQDRWILAEPVFYLVDERFPRITPTLVPVGVSNIRYSIHLPSLTEHVCSEWW